MKLNIIPHFRMSINTYKPRTLVFLPHETCCHPNHYPLMPILSKILYRDFHNLDLLSVEINKNLNDKLLSAAKHASRCLRTITGKNIYFLSITTRKYISVFERFLSVSFSIKNNSVPRIGYHEICFLSVKIASHECSSLRELSLYCTHNTYTSVNPEHSPSEKLLPVDIYFIPSLIAEYWHVQNQFETRTEDKSPLWTGRTRYLNPLNIPAWTYCNRPPLETVRLHKTKLASFPCTCATYNTFKICFCEYMDLYTPHNPDDPFKHFYRRPRHPELIQIDN